jgi:hypothetical protein
MARSDVEHFGLLNRWPVVMYESGWHFNQLAGSAMYAPLTQPCDRVYTQFQRDDIADGLNLAVELVSAELGFYPRPIWITERLDLGHGNPMEWQQLKTEWGYLNEFSIRTKTLIEAGVAVVYSDEDGDGFNETATVTVATTVDADEVRAYFQVADGAIEAGSDDWEIEPLRVTSDGVNATLVGPKWLFTDPDVVWQYPFEDPNYKTERTFDSDDPANFVDEVDIYRVYGSTTGAVKLLTDPILDCSVANSGDIAENAVGRITNSKQGFFEVRLANCTDLTNCTYYPTQIWISYKAGYPLRNQLMDRQMERQLVRIANTKIPFTPNTFCGERTLTMWQNDCETIENVSRTASPPPWGGMTVGEWDGWNMLKRLQLPRGGKITARSW